MISRKNVGGRLPLGRAAAVLALLCALAPASAQAALAPKRGGEGLAPPLAQLAKPGVLALPPGKQARALGVAAEGPGSLVRDGGRVLVNVRFHPGAAAGTAGLRGAGGRVVEASRRYRTATVAIAPAALRRLAQAPGVAAVWPSREPILRAASCEGGSVISEGFSQLQVDLARQEFGPRGAGVTVGVLSDSYDTAIEAADESGPVATRAQDDIKSNDLPGPAGTCGGQQVKAAILDEGPPKSGDEGRAMMQIVHDLAPHASLVFATAFESEESFAANIEKLGEPVIAGGAGANVIVDDVAWFEEPFFQDGPIAVAINGVTEAGVTYLTAAGNDNLFLGGAETTLGEEGIASWEAPAYRDSGACPAAIEALPGFNGTHCLDFDSGPGADRTYGITVEPGETLTVDLQWAEPWNGVTTDLDAFLLNAKGDVLTGSVALNVGKEGTQRPVEIPQWENTSDTAQTVQLAVNRYSGAEEPRVKLILLQNGGGVSATEYPETVGEDVVGPAIFGHAASASAISVAAVPFTGYIAPEEYSSRGPATHYFGPVTGVVPAAALPSPEVVAKPDLAATDCGATTFFAHNDGTAWRFCGTSAAAPHVAAVAALLHQANPLATPAQIRASLIDTGIPNGSFGPQAVGGGLLDALAAVAALPEKVPIDDPPSATVPALETDPPPVGPTGPTGPTTGPTGPTGNENAVAPDTFFRRRPAAVLRTPHIFRTVSFRLGASEVGSSFICRADQENFQPCDDRYVRLFRLGSHVLRVRARGPGGLLDETAAVFHFRVKRIR